MSETETYMCGICEQFQTPDWDEFQAHRTREILDVIEANGGPRWLDLSGKDLERIDLSREMIQAELERVRQEDPTATPQWVSSLTCGVNLMGATLVSARMMGAKLQGVDLTNASLREVDLVEAQLG